MLANLHHLLPTLTLLLVFFGFVSIVLTIWNDRSPPMRLALAFLQGFSTTVVVVCILALAILTMAGNGGA